MSSDISTQFWINEPSILCKKEEICKVFPFPNMSYEEKLNAITRLIILLTILGFVFTKSFFIFMTGIVTLIIVVLVYSLRKQKILGDVKEGFDIHKQEKQLIDPTTLKPFLKAEFEPTIKTNPLQNVLLTEIMDNPDRLAAPPSFNTTVYEDINDATKKMVQKLNPEIVNTNKQLFGDMYEKFEFDQSMRNFYSTANTRVANDQGSFAQYLYGNMISAKQGNPQALLQDNVRYTLY
jgi:hypothetical protein